MERMDKICPSCNALHWEGKKPKGYHFKNFPYGRCCDHSRVQIPHLKPLPSFLESLVGGQDRSSYFVNNARAYNSLFQLASTWAHVNEITCDCGGIWHFRVQEGIYHSLGSLIPQVGESS
jgi:hypothetical protein